MEYTSQIKTTEKMEGLRSKISDSTTFIYNRPLTDMKNRETMMTLTYELNFASTYSRFNIKFKIRKWEKVFPTDSLAIITSLLFVPLSLLPCFPSLLCLSSSSSEIIPVHSHCGLSPNHLLPIKNSIKIKSAILMLTPECHHFPTVT